jgi:transcriptional regulator with XRE-family HTH domain
LAQRCTVLLGHRVTPQHLSNLEQGHRQPSLALLQVLATVLSLDPVTLAAALSGPAPRFERPTTRAPRRDPEDLLARVQQASQQAAQAHQVYRETLVAAQHAGYSLRQLAAAVGLSPSRIRQLVNTSPRPPIPPTSVM